MNISKKIATSFFLLSLFGQTSIAATEISHPEADMKEIAHVIVSSINTNPESIIQLLQNKTEASGAHYYRITSFHIDNQSHATAILYK